MSHGEVTERSEAEAKAAAEAFDLFDLPADYFGAPHSWFRLLRDHDPVHRNADGTVLLTRYADVRTVWRDVSASVDKTEIFSRRFGEGALLEHHTTGMLFRDPPDHDRLRQVVNPFFAPRSVERFRPYIEQLVDALLDEAQEKGELDFVTEFAARIPISLITRILGVPPADGDYLRGLGLRVLFPLNPAVGQDAIDSGNAASAEFKDYLMEHIAAIRARPAAGEAESVLEVLVWAGASEGAVSEAEIVHMCLLVLNGGHETTTNLIAVSTHAMLDDPGQAADLRESADEIIGTAIEECVRFVSPLQLKGRRTTWLVETPSCVLPEGTEVVLCQASANRDERAFEDPELLDLRRRPKLPCRVRDGSARLLGPTARPSRGEPRAAEDPASLSGDGASRRPNMERERPLPRVAQSPRQGRLSAVR